MSAMKPAQFTRAVITGGRGFTDRRRIEDDLRALRGHGLRRIAEGQSRGGGADEHAHAAWLEVAGESTVRYPVDPRIDGNTRGAPLARNARMVREEHHLAVDAGETLLGLAYPDPASRGTWHCVAEMLRRGVPVVVWAPHALDVPRPHGRPHPLWKCISDGLTRHNMPNPLVFDWGTARGVVAPPGVDEHEFAALALRIRDALGD